ncbi:hypothetical protein VTG60DRAFT_2228 [Thermothelomyces hinnuleus]
MEGGRNLTTFPPSVRIKPAQRVQFGKQRSNGGELTAKPQQQPWIAWLLFRTLARKWLHSWDRKEWMFGSLDPPSEAPGAKLR